MSLTLTRRYTSFMVPLILTLNMGRGLVPAERKWDSQLRLAACLANGIDVSYSLPPLLPWGGDEKTEMVSFGDGSRR